MVAPSAHTPERWRKIEMLFHHVLETDPALRGPFLAGACGHDVGLLAACIGFREEHWPDAPGLSATVQNTLAAHEFRTTHSSESKTQLIKTYQLMKRHYAPVTERHRDALRRMIQLYEWENRPGKADAFRAQLPKEPGDSKLVGQ